MARTVHLARKDLQDHKGLRVSHPTLCRLLSCAGIQLTNQERSSQYLESSLSLSLLTEPTFGWPATPVVLATTSVKCVPATVLCSRRLLCRPCRPSSSMAPTFGRQATAAAP